MSKAPSDGAAQQAAVAVAQQQKMDRTLVLLIVIFIFLAGYVGYGFLPERNYVSTTQNAGGVEAKSHTVVAISESSSAESLPRPSKPKAAPVAPVPASAFRVEQFIPSPTEALNVTLWYPVDCSWERDYFMHDLIGPAVGGLVKFRDLEPRNSPSWDRKERKNHIVDPDESNIVIFHGMIEDGQKCHNTIVEKSQYYQPAVAFILSDEHGASSCGNEKLSHLVPLVMRHYSAESHGMPRHKNVFNLPLGTNTGQKFPTRDKLQKASERPKKWAFIGNNKHDRRHMLSVLATRFPEQEQALDKQVPTHQIADVYSKAIFVPNTQGQVSYDCFRLYEATRAGAIPVMVGPPDKMKQTFGHFIGSDGEMPPWIFATSWEQAADKMEELLKDPAAVDARQKANLDWWDTVMTTTKKAIRAAVEADYARRRFAKAMGLAFREVGREDVAEWIERRPDPLSSR